MKSPRRPPFIVAFLLDLGYYLFALVAWPVLLPMFLLKKKWREGFAQRLGFVPKLPPHPLRIWIHAISVGESEAAQPLVKALREKYPQAELVISNTTRTGRARAAKLFPDLRNFQYPIDFPWAVRGAFSRIKPALIIQVEAEWWPTFLFKAVRRGLPVCVVNLRITEKGLRGYNRFRKFSSRMINATTFVAVQNEEYRQRLLSLGADPERIAVTGQMKYDNISLDAVPGADRLARDLGLAKGERLLVAGSTGPGEEEMLLDAYAKLKPQQPELRLAIVPRKPERFDEVAKLISDRGFRLVRRSATQTSPASPDAEAVILGDTMGELMKFYQLAKLAFIGRSLVPLGGSNPIDPASLGVPLVFGPHMFNFPDADELFVASGAARQVADGGDSLVKTLGELLQSGDAPAAMGEKGRGAVRERQGATGRNMKLLAEVIEKKRFIR
jgi:3-deoxy-D-manno-octulosonic-acid transferase